MWLPGFLILYEQANRRTGEQANALKSPFDLALFIRAWHIIRNGKEPNSSRIDDTTQAADVQ